MKQKINFFLKNNYKEYLIILILCLSGGFFYYQLTKAINPIIYEKSTSDTWFEADINRVILNMTDRLSDNGRARVHPLFTLVTFPILSFLTKIIGLWHIAAVRIFFSSLSIIWIFLIYILLRSLNIKLIDRIIYTILSIVCSSSIFWIPIPETYLIGSITITLALIIAVRAEKEKLNGIWFFLINFLTLSFLISNWILGLIVTFFNNSFKKGLQISLNAFTSVVILWSLQRYYFIYTDFFLVLHNEKDFINHISFQQIFQTLKILFIDSIFMPEISFRYNPYSTNNLQLSIQNSMSTANNMVNSFGIVIWLILFLFGIWHFFKSKNYKNFQWIIGVFLLFQTILHIIYGDETFLYTLNLLPVLIILVSHGSQSKYRKLFLIFIGLFVIFTLINNLQMFQEAKMFYETIPLVSK